jgi:hypothetical protein
MAVCRVKITLQALFGGFMREAQQTAKAGRIIGIFALLMAQKSTSATGC